MKEKIVLPNYEKSILNTINSILKYYQVETAYDGLPELEEILKEDYQNVILIILDGMGENLIRTLSPNGFFMKYHKSTLTTVCPSTTTAAMTTYYSGKPPIETGWIAMSQYFKEYGRAIEMMRQTDTYTGEKYEKINQDIFDLVKYESVYEQIEKASKQIKAYEISPSFCQTKGKRKIDADNLTLMADAIETLCKNPGDKFIFAYQENPDSILHKYGCQSKEAKQFIKQAEEVLETMCEKLKETNSLVIISADHGHKDIKEKYEMVNLKEIQDCLIMPPSLESRAVTFWVKADKKETFEKVFKKQFEDQFILYKKEEFLAKKLLGYGNQHPKIDDFIGDYIAISISDSIIKLGTKLSKEKKDKLSTHCGFTKEEMEVPLIIIK